MSWSKDFLFAILNGVDRLFKQIVIGVIYITLFAGIGYGVKRLLVVEPTCFDRIQNQGEERADCGVVCGNLCDPVTMPLEVESVQLFPAGKGLVDVLVLLTNPNGVYGSGKISYELIFKDAQGLELKDNKYSGQFYIMPAQRRYLVISSLPVSADAETASIDIKDVAWVKVNIAEMPQIDFVLRREEYKDLGTVGAVFEGVIQNNSDFDFAKIDISIILLDESGQPIAVNSTDVRTLLSREERYFKVQWSVPVPDSASRIVDSATNAFLNENFIKKYGSSEKFQQYR